MKILSSVDIGIDEKTPTVDIGIDEEVTYF